MEDESIYPLACRFPEDKPCLHVFTDLPSSGGGSPAGRNLPKRKRKVDIASALEAHERAQQASNALRSQAGLSPLADNSIVATWREKAAKTPRAASKPVDNPLDELRKAVAARKRAESRIMAAARAAKEAAGAATVASELGMTRQGVYAMLARA